MKAIPVVLIFDVGKTNKKVLLFDESYNLVLEETVNLAEVRDEDNFPCEDVSALTLWVRESFDRLTGDPRFDIRAVNFSAYGASFVYVDEQLNPVLPLYNYLKPYPETLRKKFYDSVGGESEFSQRSASPVLGSLNSGMQMFRLKHERPEVFETIKYALHLPQYLSSIITNNPVSDLTSIGCHTNLWDFIKSDYHEWVSAEDLHSKFPPIVPTDDSLKLKVNDKLCRFGVGIHDSSAALVPYLFTLHDPFLLISTGTWCITLNPFNHSPLSAHELENDCLCYLTFQGTPVKASRYFGGHEHELEVKRLSRHYRVSEESFNSMKLNREALNRAKSVGTLNEAALQNITPEEAYHAVMLNIVSKQIASTRLVLKNTEAREIFVDGGFSKNEIYMSLLADEFHELELYAASVSQASALGAALVIHHHWNKNPLPKNLLQLKRFFPSTKDLKV